MAFVCKQTTALVVRINNIGQYQWCFDRLLAIFLTLYFVTYLSLAGCLYFYSFYSFENLTHLPTILPFGSLLSPIQKKKGIITLGYFRADIKIPSLQPQTVHKMLQNHLRGSVTQSVIFADVSQN